MSPAVSVCIPVYNGQAFIRDAVDSALAQTFSDLELVVVDNASTDGTLDVLESYRDSRLRTVASRVHVGAVENWNRALSLARGRYVKLLCADDTLLPDCLERQVSILSDFPDVALVAGQRHIVDDQGRIILRARGLSRLDGVVPTGEALRTTVTNGTNVFGEVACGLIRLEDVHRTGPFSARWPYMVDLDYWCRILAHGKLFALRAPVATFRIATGSWSAQIGLQQSRQAAALFRDLEEQNPDSLSRRHVLLGSARAAALAAGRAASYRLLTLRHRVEGAGAGPQ